MSTLNKLLLLGDDRLFNTSQSVHKEEFSQLLTPIGELHQIILEFRNKYGSGRAVAAPQIGLFRRIICWNINYPVTMINPVLSGKSEEMMTLWDDCMCFPGLLVRVKRHVKCTLTFFDERWEQHKWKLSGSESELIQHEVDHLDGILATQRAVDGKSFKMSMNDTRN